MSLCLIQFSHLFKSFGSFVLFEDISLSIHNGETFALIGENGCGKTTLLQLLSGIILPEKGLLTKTANLRMSYLPQEVICTPFNITARKYIQEGDCFELEKQMKACLELDQLDRWAELHDKYEKLGGYQQMPIEKVLNGLKLDASLLVLPMTRLSSGQRSRIALAKAFISNPDLLLLDEPTNHLDKEILNWLKEALHLRKGATIIVSHDRKFLNETCNHLIEIKNGKLNSFGGNYDFYLEEKKRLLEKQMKDYQLHEEEKFILKQKIKGMTFSKRKPSPSTDKNIMAYDYRGGNYQKSQQHNLDVLKNRLEEIEKNPIPHPKSKTIKGLRFSSAELASHVAIELVQISKSFGEKKLFSNFNKILCKGDKIVLIGANGCGKTTLLRCIAKIIHIDSGNIRYAPTAKIAYLDQNVELLPMEKTPLEYFESRFHLSEEDLRRELHKAAIGGEELLNRPFSTLSVGQRKRFMLLSIILEKPNVLLLDEPTNHLDFLTLEAFETALLNFDGVILAVSHDESFIEKIAAQKWIL
jgi:ATP-binding cassette, subfamily F, member 3